MDKKEYMYKVYSRSRDTLYQYIVDGTFDKFSDTNFNSQFESVGTPTIFSKNRLDAYPSQTLGYAISFDGTDDKLTLPVPGIGVGDIVLTNDYTVLINWYKANWSDARQECIVDCTWSQAGSFSGFTICRNRSGSGNLSVVAGYSSGLGNVATLDYALSNLSAGWHQIGFHIASGVMDLIVDGAVVLSNSPGAGTPTFGFSMPIIVGNSNFITGAGNSLATVENLGIYRNITTADIYAMYRGQIPKGGSAAAYFDFDEGTGTTSTDSVAGYIATLDNGPTWVTGVTGTKRSAFVITSTGGSSQQGFKLKDSSRISITGGQSYYASAWVKTTVGGTINLILTPDVGTAVTTTVTATGSWQFVSALINTGSSATKLAVSVTLSNANASEKILYVENLGVTSQGQLAIPYFDDKVAPNTTVQLFNFQIVNGNIYSYQVFNTTFIAVWNDVISDFGYPQEINAAGSEVSVTLGRAYPDYGEGVDLDFNLEVRVLMIDDNNINGRQVFKGYISDYIIDENKETIEVKLFGFGAELTQYILETGTKRVGYMPIFTSNPDPGSTFATWFMQEIDTKNGAVAVSKIVLLSNHDLSGNPLKLYKGDPRQNTAFTGNLTGLLYKSRDLSHEFVGQSTSATASVSAGVYTITYNFDDLRLEQGFKFYFEFVYQGSVTDIIYGAAGTDLGATGYTPIGALVTLYATASLGNTLTQRVGGAFYIEMYERKGSTAVSYESVDPSYIVRDAMADYTRQGGSLTYDDTSIPLSGSVVSYDYNTANILDVIKKALELAPSGWHFFIDHAANKLYFKQKSTTPDHKFVVGQHLANLAFEKRSRDIVNTIYFTGGEISPGVNLYKKYEDSNSVALYGRRLQNYTDNRVKLESTADTIANNILATRSFPEIRTSPNVINYDLESIKPGDMVTFRGYESTPGQGGRYDIGKYDSSYYDFNIADPSTYILQIARLNYNADHADMTLSTTPPDVNKRIEDINRNLEKQQTVNNPDTPS